MWFKYKDVVVFRKFKKEGDIIALFPLIDEGQGKCNSYQRIGQHGAADYKHCIKISIPATPNEYKALKKELISIGYILNIRTRKPVVK